jgi:hypothetical protein
MLQSAKPLFYQIDLSTHVFHANFFHFRAKTHLAIAGARAHSDGLIDNFRRSVGAASQ